MVLGSTVDSICTTEGRNDEGFGICLLSRAFLAGSVGGAAEATSHVE